MIIKITNNMKHLFTFNERLKGWLVNLVNLVMQFLKLTKLTKLTEQFFATSATFASANFVGKESCESTVKFGQKFGLKSRITTTCLRLASALTLICLLGVGNVLGADVTYTFKDNYSSNTVLDGTSIALDSYTNATFNKRNGGTATQYYTNGYAVRWYGGGTLAVTSSKAISKIEITFTQTANTISTNVGSYSEGTWTGNASSVTFTQSGTSGQCRISAIAITYAASAKKLSSISITTQPTKRKYLAGQTFSSTGAVVRATYSDASTANVTATWTPTTALTAETGKTITASYTEDGTTKTATTTVDVYSVTVQVKDEDGNTLSGSGMPTASATGANITASASGNNYVFKQWEAVTAAGTTFASSASASTTLNGNPTGSVTIKAVYRKPITITYKANGQNFTTQTYGYGGTLAFPTSNPDGATYSCTGKTFVGWVGEANKDYSHASSAPTYATDGGSVETGATYYAVFADADEGEAVEGWQQCATLDDFVDGDFYLFVSPEYNNTHYYVPAPSGAISQEMYSSTADGNQVASNSNPTSITKAQGAWKLIKSSTSWKIQSSNASTIYLYSGTNNNKLGAAVATTASSTWSITKHASSSTFAFQYNSSRYLCAYNQSPYGFRTYTGTSTNGTAYLTVYHWVSNSGTTYSNFGTTCCTSYTVSLVDANGVVTGGTYDANPKSACEGNPVSLTKEVSTGYTFGGWTVMNGETPVSVNNDAFSMPAANVTVQASFTANKHNVVFHKNDGSATTTSQEFTFGVAQNLTANAWSRSGYNFGGWMTAYDGEAADYSDGASYTLSVDEDVNLYALWIPDNTRSITYNGDAHISSYTAQPATVAEDAANIAITFALESNYELKSVAVTMGGAAIAADKIAFTQSSLTITAPAGGFTDNISITYTIEEMKYTVHFSMNGNVTDKQVVRGQALNDIPTPGALTGFTFEGWASATLAETTTEPASYALNKTATSYTLEEDNVTFYAVYSRVEETELDGFKLSFTTSTPSTYYAGPMGSESYFSSQSSATNAEILFEEAAETAGQVYLYFYNGNTKTYIYTGTTTSSPNPVSKFPI